MPIKYRFSIDGQSVSPIYSDDLAKEYTMEPGQRFYRATLSGKLTFIKGDFDWLDSQPFETEFVLLIEMYNGSTWSDYWTGKFYKTDGDWNEDDKKVEVKVEVRDSYAAVLAGLEKEYNLIKLAPAKTPLEIQKRPLIQIYNPGDSVVSCFLGGNYWEQDVAFEEEDTNALINTYFFALASTLTKINVTTSDTVPANRLGDYVGESATEWYNADRVAKIELRTLLAYLVNPISGDDKDSSDLGSIWRDINNNDWRLIGFDGSSIRFAQYNHTQTMPLPGEFETFTLSHVAGATNTTTISYENRTVSDNIYKYFLSLVIDGVPLYKSQDFTVPVVTGAITFSEISGSDVLTGDKTDIEIYARYLLDVEVIQSLPTYPLPADDIVVDNRNYKRAIGYAIDSVSISTATQVEPTEYGLADNGEYFLPPYFFGEKFYPIARSTWGFSSAWFNFSTFDFILEEAGCKPYTFKEASPIYSVISVLLAEVAPGIIHNGDSAFSEFLYAFANPVSGQAFKVLLTQKSNILYGEFDRPAQKAPITLGSVLSMLRDVFQCYWFIDNGLFRIEHISWFKNGGSYTGGPQYTADITTLLEPRNKKPWGLYSNKYSYDRADMAERIEFKWMDDVTEGFTGLPVNINSKFVQEGKIDNINVGEFTTDVDYMLLNPSELNPEGFALFAAVWDTDKYILPFKNLDIDGAELRLQNGILSWPYLQPHYWTYDLPANDVEINGEPGFVNGIQRGKKQKARYPSLTDPDPIKLVKTYLGDGEIQKISVNLSSRMNDLTLKYDTE